MPNWVDNELTVSGSPEAIAKFKEQAGKAYPVGVDEKTNELEYETLAISFWNFVAPPQEALPGLFPGRTDVSFIIRI